MGRGCKHLSSMAPVYLIHPPLLNKGLGVPQVTVLPILASQGFSSQAQTQGKIGGSRGSATHSSWCSIFWEPQAKDCPVPAGHAVPKVPDTTALQASCDFQPW